MLNDEYRKARRNLLSRIRRLEKKGVAVDREKVIPPKPQQITQGSVSRLNALTAERILKRSGVKQARPVKAKEPKEVKTAVRKKLPVKKTKLEEFREEWNSELNRLGRVVNRLERKGNVAKGVNIHKEFPVPVHISPAKLRALQNVTAGQLERMFPSPEGPKRKLKIPVRKGARITPKSQQTHGPSGTETAVEKISEGAAQVNGIWFDPESGKVVGGENADKAELHNGRLIDTRTGDIIWKSPDVKQERLESAGGIVYNPKTGEVVVVSDAARIHYSVMPGDEDRFIVSENGGLVDTRTGEWIFDGELERGAESVETATVSEAVNGETVSERKKKGREKDKRLHYNPETDTVEEVPYWDDDENAVFAPPEEILGGLTETDQMVYDILHDDSLPHDYARIQEILKRVKSRPARLPAESYKDYLDRLIQHIRTRAYQDELGDFPERNMGESAESYLKRLASLMEANGHDTLTRMEENKEKAIRGALAKRLGYDPFKPVDENDAVSVEMVLNYIVKHWNVLKGNLPRGFSYYGKPDEVGIRLALEKMDERSRRNFYYAREAAVKRDEARKRKYTPVEDLPVTTEEEAIDIRFNNLVKQFRGTDIETQANMLREIWKGVKKRWGDNLSGFLKEHGSEIVRELDEMVPDWWQYYINSVEESTGGFTLPDTRLIYALGAGSPLSTRDLMGWGVETA